jgi:hypothetical protein
MKSIDFRLLDLCQDSYIGFSPLTPAGSPSSPVLATPSQLRQGAYGLGFGVGVRVGGGLGRGKRGFSSGLRGMVVGGREMAVGGGRWTSAGGKAAAAPPKPQGWRRVVGRHRRRGQSKRVVRRRRPVVADPAAGSR